jgi:hypothetical protein
VTRHRTGALTYLWGHRYGRLCLLLVAAATLGLTVHYWTTAPLLLALTRRHLGLGGAR